MQWDGKLCNREINGGISMKKVIGIDLGGTSIYGGIIDEDGKVLKRVEIETPTGKGRKGVLDGIIEVINELMEEGILGIGIGSPGCIDSIEGKVLEIGGNIEEWANTDIRGEISKAFPEMNIYVENDANVAALCENWIGAGKDFNNFVMLTLGTGVGGAIYTEKEGILKGHGFQGGELGHAILYPKGIQCNCGQQGCVDKYISGNAVGKRYFELTGERKKGKDIFKDSLLDEISKKVIDEYCEDLAIYIASLKNIFDPQGLIIGGGVINSKDIWWDKMKEYFKKHSNSTNTIEIVPAIYLNDAGMIGAGRVVLINENK